MIAPDMLARMDREAIEGLIIAAIDYLDTLDRPADPDEPDFTPRRDGRPGDEADGEPDSDGQDWAYSEWHTRNEYGQRASFEADSLETCGRSEDDEPDDFAEDDDAHGDECGDVDNWRKPPPRYGIDQSRPIDVA